MKHSFAYNNVFKTKIENGVFRSYLQSQTQQFLPGHLGNVKILKYNILNKLFCMLDVRNSVITYVLISIKISYNCSACNIAYVTLSRFYFDECDSPLVKLKIWKEVLLLLLKISPEIYKYIQKSFIL